MPLANIPAIAATIAIGDDRFVMIFSVGGTPQITPPRHRYIIELNPPS
jgi:hypothetical protein